MSEVLSTAGLLIDVGAVLGLIVLAHAESGGPATMGPKKDLPKALRLKWDTMWCHKALLYWSAARLVGLVVGTGLMVAGIWL